MKALKNPSDPVKQRGLKERLDEDPVGVKDRPYTDTLCYTATEGVRLLESGTDVTEQLSGAMRASAVLTSPPVTRSAAAGGTGTSEDDPGSDAEAPQQQIMVNRTQYRTTNFHEQLKTHQEELYIRLRSDLPSYMDPTSSSQLQLHVQKIQQDIAWNDTELTEANFFHRDKRPKWANIKAFVVTLCREPLESDKFVKLLKVKRDDATTITAWLNTVRDIKRDIDKMGTHWKHIVKPEAMEIASRWLTQVEKKLFDTLVIKMGDQQQYPTFDDLVAKMNIDSFLEYSTHLDPKRVPKNFKQSKHTQALRVTLLTYAEAEAMVDEGAGRYHTQC